jgi:hypothetical protein
MQIVISDENKGLDERDASCGRPTADISWYYIQCQTKERRIDGMRVRVRKRNLNTSQHNQWLLNERKCKESKHFSALAKTMQPRNCRQRAMDKVPNMRRPNMRRHNIALPAYLYSIFTQWRDLMLAAHAPLGRDGFSVCSGCVPGVDPVFSVTFR